MAFSVIFPLFAGQDSEVIDRIPGGYSHFVLPFVIGINFALSWLFIGFLRNFFSLPVEDRKSFLLSLITPKIILKNIKDIFLDCLLHIKIWKRKPILGYMHSAIAFGWFVLIILGHIEVALFVPKHMSFKEGALFYPIFYRFFVWVDPGHVSLRGSFFFFLMDFFLLYVLSGIGLAMFKRVRSRVLGIRHTTKPSLADRVALCCLWLIFPLRLVAESFTADLSGGSFLTVPINSFLRMIFGDSLYFMPAWWAYSICLGLFFVAMPFSRYMHILTEVLLILYRNAGLCVRKARKGFGEAEIYACASCGLCLDACPMTVQKKNLKYSSVYFIRFLRRHNEKNVNEIAKKCLMCGKCHALCPVGIDAPAIRAVQRETVYDSQPYKYEYMKGLSPIENEGRKVMYFAGCMSSLTPRITKAVERIFAASGTEFVWADRDGGLCCGRPLMLAGKKAAAKEVVEANKKRILESRCDTLVLSCPICYRTFVQDYHLEGIRVLHYTQFIDELVEQGRLSVGKGEASCVYHDPCELGRGCGIYEEPRRVLRRMGALRPASSEGDESVCCGGSLGSLSLDHKDRGKITEGAIASLLSGKPDCIVTACPLCLKTFSEHSPVPVKDFAESVCENLLAAGKIS